MTSSRSRNLRLQVGAAAGSSRSPSPNTAPSWPPLNSPRTTEVSVYVVRAFVQLRDTLIAHKELAPRLDELESRIERKLSTHDQAITGILDAIRQLMTPPEPAKRRPIGFVTPEENKRG